jgi:anti-anti-sigma factor
MLQNAQRLKRGNIGVMESIAITGPFDFNDPQADILASQILDEGNTSLVFDLSKTTYMTSPGVSCIVKILKKVQAAKGILYVSGATHDMVELFTLAHIDRFIRII